MKKHFTQTLLFILAFNCGVYAQSYEIKEGSIYLGEKQRNGLICYVDVPAKLLMNAWQAHLTQNFGVNLDKKKNDDNNLFTAKKVVLAGITPHAADFFTQVNPQNNKAVLGISVGNGYDGYINSKENKAEFAQLQRVTTDFLSKFCIEYYTNLLNNKEAAYQLAARELQNLENATNLGEGKQGQAEAFRAAKVRYDQLGGTKTAELASIAKNKKEVLGCQLKIKDLYKEMPTFENRTEFRFKQDNIKYYDDVYNGFTGYVNAAPADVAQAWKSYVKNNLKVDLKDKKDIYFEAKDVVLLGISDKKGDFKSLIEPYGNGTKISISVAMGRDIAINSRDYPYENNNLKRFVKGFADLYQKNVFQAISYDKQPEYNKLIENIINTEKKIKNSEANLVQFRQDSIEIAILLDELQTTNGKNREFKPDLEAKKAKLVGLKAEVVNYRNILEKNMYKVSASTATETAEASFAGLGAMPTPASTKRMEMERVVSDVAHNEQADSKALVAKNMVKLTETAAKPMPPALRSIAQKNAQKFYMVQKGDTLYSISAKLGTTVVELKAQNKLADDVVIYPGFRLTIPAAAQ